MHLQSGCSCGGKDSSCKKINSWSSKTEINMERKGTKETAAWPNFINIFRQPSMCVEASVINFQHISTRHVWCGSPQVCPQKACLAKKETIATWLLLERNVEGTVSTASSQMLKEAICIGLRFPEKGTELKDTNSERM